MRLLTLFGGVTGFIYCFLVIFKSNGLILTFQHSDLNWLTLRFIGMLIACFTMILALKPDKPIPWHYLTLGAFGILVLIFCHVLPGLLVLIAAAIGTIDDIGDKTERE